MALSEEQMKIVHHPAEKHAVVLAVAGSGKSTTMAERIAYLVEAKRVDPQHVIAVMFNKAAADELGDKLIKRLGRHNAPASATYHRLGTLTLKRLITERLAPDWEFEANPVAAQRFAVSVIERLCAKYGHKYPNIVADAFLGFVDRVKGDLVSPERAWQEGDWQAKYAWFPGAYPLYEKARAAAKKRFFSDLIYDPVMLMQQNPKAAAAVANRYAHIIVDEYQDICESQQALVRFVAGSKARVMVVGDDDQTIYTWRGAKPSYILRDFQRDFKGATVYQLTRTWRYGHALSCAANYVICRNQDRASKLCVSGEKAPHTELALEWDAGDGQKELEIANNWLAKGGRLNEVAMLTRTYSKSAATQFAMLRAGMPFRLEGGDEASVLDNKWVKCLLGWMALAVGRIAERPYIGEPDGSSIYEAQQVINMPSLGLIYSEAKQLATEALKNPASIEPFAAFCQAHPNYGPVRDRVMQRGKLWLSVRGLAAGAATIKASAFVEQLISALEIEQSIYREVKKAEEADDICELVHAFLSYIRSQQEQGLPAVVRHLDDLRSFSERAKEATDAIHMTSIHRSKGLEWPCVIMLSLWQGAFPLKPRQHLEGEKADSHLEDERRLFYVGMTRAKRFLHLLSPEDPNLHQWLRAGKTGSPPLDSDRENRRASQFLYESNLYLAKTMPMMLKRPLDLKAADPEIYNEYLNLVGCKRAVKKLSVSVTTRGE